MTDETIIAEHNMIQDSTYDRLAAWGRRWLPLATVFFIALSGVFMELSKVPGLEGAAPWLVAIGGILAAVSAGINEFLKRAKDLWVKAETTAALKSDNVDISDPKNASLYYFMTPEEREAFPVLHPEFVSDDTKQPE